MIRRLSLYLFALSLSVALAAAPRLTVVIAIEGLTEQNLQLMRPYWPQGGLRTLSEEAYQTTFAYPHPVYGGIETLATILTGTTPSEHGLTMSACYDRKTRTAHRLLEDKQEKGIGTKTAWSSRALLTPTVGDLLRMQAGEKAHIYAIGIRPDNTVLMAGHSANAACWLDADTHKWVATTYFSEGLPTEADKMNMSTRMADMLARVWTPRMDILTYSHPTEQEKKKSFSFETQRVLLTSPVANELVIQLALDIQQGHNLGTDPTPDMLLLQLTALSPNAKTDLIRSAEQEDQYLWLNQHIGFLMEQLDRRIGKQNYQIVLVGQPALGTGNDALRMAGLPTQVLNVDRVAALTSTYLMAIYGHERWIDGGYGQAIFLNRTLIEQKHLSLETIRRQVADFLLEFEGIRMAYPMNEAFLAPEISLWVNKRSAGDVVFVPQPGWTLYSNDNNAFDHIVDLNPTSPLLMWSGSFRNYPSGKITATDVADLIAQ